MATNTSLLTGHVASRERSTNFVALGMMLPNPDPILKAQGRDIEVYRNLRGDALVGGCIRRRKAAVKALEWGIDRGHAASRVAKSVEAMLQDLDLEQLFGQAMEAVLYGYQPLEVMWRRVGGLLVPAEVQAKPPEWFSFDADNQLRFKSREQPLYGELVPPRKFLLPRQDATYANPYGFADLSMCFWPLTFKKGGLKFWLAFTEKFGSAFSVGKLPRSAEDKERNDLLTALQDLIQDGVAVIPDDGSVELVEMAGKSASADLYERLVMHCRGEISIALLGQNQTTEASANRASATAGLEVTRDLRDGDAALVEAAVNQLIRWVCEVNFGGGTEPIFSLWDQEAQDQLQAQRDKSNHEAGARFTNRYWMRAYGYQEEDLQPDVVEPAFAEAGTGTATAVGLRADTNALVAAAAPGWTAMAEQLQTIVDQAQSLGELQQAMVNAYGGLASGELVKLMAAAMALAELKGLDAVRAEG